MKMPFILKLGICALLGFQLFPSSVIADDVEFVIAKWANKKSCNSQISSKVNSVEFYENIQNYMGKCVTVKGFYNYRALYLNENYYDYSGPSWNANLEKIRVGISANPENMEALSHFDGYGPVTVTGKVMNCRDDVWMGGYCHYVSGAYIGVSEVNG